jgi:hypothetical protein
VICSLPFIIVSIDLILSKIRFIIGRIIALGTPTLAAILRSPLCRGRLIVAVRVTFRRKVRSP